MLKRNRTSASQTCDDELPRKFPKLDLLPPKKPPSSTPPNIFNQNHNRTTQSLNCDEKQSITGVRALRRSTKGPQSSLLPLSPVNHNVHCIISTAEPQNSLIEKPLQGEEKRKRSPGYRSEEESLPSPTRSPSSEEDATERSHITSPATSPASIRLSASHTKASPGSIFYPASSGELRLKADLAHSDKQDALILTDILVGSIENAPTKYENLARGVSPSDEIFQQLKRSMQLSTWFYSAFDLSCPYQNGKNIQRNRTMWIDSAHRVEQFFKSEMQQFSRYKLSSGPPYELTAELEFRLHKLQASMRSDLHQSAKRAIGSLFPDLVKCRGNSSCPPTKQEMREQVDKYLAQSKFHHVDDKVSSRPFENDVLWKFFDKKTWSWFKQNEGWEDVVENVTDEMIRNLICLLCATLYAALRSFRRKISGSNDPRWDWYQARLDFEQQLKNFQICMKGERHRTLMETWKGRLRAKSRRDGTPLADIFLDN